MKVTKVSVRNFRLLKDISIFLEDSTTVVVGRNNSGKTSLTELFRRLLNDSMPRFTLEDFSISTYDDFWYALKLYTDGGTSEEINDAVPSIETELHVSYELADGDLTALSDFIIDLDLGTKEIHALIRYQVDIGKISSFFEGCSYYDSPQHKSEFFKTIKDRVPRFFGVTLVAVDPTDETNQKELEFSSFRKMLQGGFISAQRGLDDATHKERDVLGHVLEKLLSAATEETAVTSEGQIVQELGHVVDDIQEKLASEFNSRLNRLLPALETMGYPGLGDPHLHTETTLDVQRLLENHTKIRYEIESGVGLPETYNGLGSRNLIYILFKLFEFFKSFQARQASTGLHLIFIEEPEAHLHPQMQEVFVRQIGEIVRVFEDTLNNGQSWPVQFVISTHSTHLANQAPFEAIRYFFARRDVSRRHLTTRIKDLKDGFKAKDLSNDKEFLNKYMTLTRCDLFFADKAMLIEGPTERLLMPTMIRKVDSESKSKKLSSQYVSVIEVGGAYAHHFYRLLDFLELPSLIITDMDSVKDSKKCEVAEGLKTSNEAIKNWFSDPQISPQLLLRKTFQEKTIEYRCIAYQVPEVGSGACGRSFEDAFMLANPDLFNIDGTTDVERAADAFMRAQDIHKTNFAIRYGIEQTEWVVPRYIREGLSWLVNAGAEYSDPSSDDIESVDREQSPNQMEV